MADELTTAAALTALGGALVATSAASAQTTLPPPGPKSTGTPGPGEYAGGQVRFDRTGIGANLTFGNFGCTVFKENANTPDWMTANVYFVRKVRNMDIRMPDGRDLRCWIFEDTLRTSGKREQLPSATIRVQEDDLVHVKLESSKGSHTIHHHGIEPTTMNDGVGHVSMEITGSYIYQWQPKKAGTYFYHCHKNTVTHFEMGLYGMLIVDPKPDAQGLVRAYEDGPHYDVEAIWALDDMDPRWHRITDDDHDVGLCGDDSGLHIFEPKYFLLSGTPSRPGVNVTKQKVVANAGEQILIRLLNASYSLLAVTFESLRVQIIAVDGHPLNRPWNRPVSVPPGETIYLSSAQRYDIMIDTSLPANNKKKYKGVNPVTFEFQHWITRKRHNAGDPLYDGIVRTTIEFPGWSA